LKRYRYTGKERDEETGLYYYGARYYISWLGRWLNTDPAGLIDGTNVYTFSVCNPIRLTDPDGAATLAEEEAAQATLPELHGTALEEEQLVSLPEEHPEDEVCRMEEPPAPPAPAADPVPQEDPIGESGVRLRADAPREHYDNFVAQDMASHGYLNLAEIAEAGHGCAFCHIVKNYSTLREANASVDLAHYNMVSVFMANARDQLALTVATVPITAAMAPARLGTVAASSQTVIRTEAAVTTAAEGTAAAGDMVTIYRGTSHVAELETLADSGFVMSDAARTAFVEARYAGATVQEALQTANVASEAAHANQLRVWGSLADYTQAHGAFGTEISTFGPRSMISFTTNPGVAARFAGSTGTVLSATVPRSMLIPQTLAGATESEVLILHWLELGGL
jgi:RHS repeat-associated protein